MKKKIIEFAKSYLVGLICGGLCAGIVVVYAETYFPSKDTIYDNTASGLQSNNVQDAIDELYGVCFPPKGSDTIIDLLPDNPDELYKDEHGDIRYYGASPNNYVSFNNELWRIIGVIDGKIKIVRNQNIRNREWNTSQSNDWTQPAYVNNYLNGVYYNSINEIYKKMISNETYYLGGPTDNNYKTLTASGYYNAERSNTVLSGNPTSTTQNIGLMYPSDYGYAAGEICLSIALYNYSSSCKNSDWLYSGESEWLQTPFASNNTYATYLYSGGSVLSGGVAGSYAVRSVVYLSSEVQITGGDGSQSNPFELSL